MKAMCFTKAANTLKGYFNQQLRWKRSNIVDFIIFTMDAWKLHPLMCVQYLSMLALLLIYPFLIITHLIAGQFFQLVMFHCAIIALFGCIYYFAPSIRRLPPWLRVHPLSFLPMAVMMPAAYIILTPLGLFTLDSSSWETRGAPAAAKTPGAVK
jgi:hypothetical protein